MTTTPFTAVCGPDEGVQPDHRLGRHVEHDNRSKGYPARTASFTGSLTRLWAHGAPVLDQGNGGCCTGAATVQLLNCSAMHKARKAVHGDDDYLTLAHAWTLYGRATQLDEFAGEYPPLDTGSSGLAIAKAAKEAGYITEYQHAFGMAHLLGALQVTPVIVGTWWYEGMSKLDRKWRAHTTGRRIGGHEYLCLGADYRHRELTFLNSWGADWGKRGRFYMSFDEYEALLADDGDATVLVGPK